MLEGRVAVVTGGGRGIGRAHSLRLASYGAAVVVNDLGVAMDGSTTGETPAEEVVAEIRAAGGTAVADGSDIGTASGGAALVQTAIDTWGRIDVVVNNAGIGRPRMIFNMSEDEFDDVVRVHLKGAWTTTRVACEWWRSESKAGRGGYGRVINTATGLLLYGGAGQSNYAAAKAGVVAMTDAVATEMAPYGVTANCLMPSARTRMAQVGWRIDRAASEDGEFDATDPVHVAEAVCFLASPAAQWISAQCFQVRGGTIERVRAYAVDGVLERHDRGWTAAELAAEMPRFYGAGPKRADPPPPGWQAQYRAGRTSTASPRWPGT